MGKLEHGFVLIRRDGCAERIHQVQRLHGGRYVHKLLIDASSGVKSGRENSRQFFLVEKFPSNCEPTVIDIVLRSADCQYYAIPRNILGMQSPNDPIRDRLHRSAVRGDGWYFSNGKAVGGDIHLLCGTKSADAAFDGDLYLLSRQGRSWKTEELLDIPVLLDVLVLPMLPSRSRGSSGFGLSFALLV